MKSWHGRKLTVWLSLIIFTCIATPLFADADSDDSSPYQTSLVQVMLGAARYSNLNLNYQSPDYPAVSATSTFTWMPLIGVSGAVPITKKSVAFGIEGSALFSWMTDSVSATGTVPGQVNLHVDNQLYLLDFSIGPYVSAVVDKKVRIYGAAGPILLYGQNNNQSDQYVYADGSTVYDNSTSAAFGPGVYARTGIEFRLKNNSWMGVGVRGFMSQLNFSNVSGTTDVNGIQMMITYTVGIKPDVDNPWYTGD